MSRDVVATLAVARIIHRPCPLASKSSTPLDQRDIIT
jgi:hypothetical protein